MRVFTVWATTTNEAHIVCMSVYLSFNSKHHVHCDKLTHSQASARTWHSAAITIDGCVGACICANCHSNPFEVSSMFCRCWQIHHQRWKCVRCINFDFVYELFEQETRLFRIDMISHRMLCRFKWHFVHLTCDMNRIAWMIKHLILVSISNLNLSACWNKDCLKHWKSQPNKTQLNAHVG